MATERRVKCVTKDSKGVITHIGNSGETWSPKSEATAIAEIEGGSYSYYVWEDSAKTTVQVKQGAYRKYLETTADKTKKNNLDNLPSC